MEGEIDAPPPRLPQLLVDLVGKGDFRLIINLDEVGLDSTGLWCWSVA